MSVNIRPLHSKKLTNGGHAAHGGAAPDLERKARLASFAIERGQVGALRRHLAAGLHPDSNFHHGILGPDQWTLIERTAWIGQLECFKVLENAGARITAQVIKNAIDDSHDHEVLAHLLASKAFDPRASMARGCSWIDYAAKHSPEASPPLSRGVSELEQAELDSAVAPPTSTRARRFL